MQRTRAIPVAWMSPGLCLNRNKGWIPIIIIWHRIKWRGSRHFGKITGQNSRPQFHLPPLGSLALWRTWRHLVAKVGTSKRGGKQWQTTPNNLSRMQRTRAIPVAWMSSGLCPNRNKGWIPIIIIWHRIFFTGVWQQSRFYRCSEAKAPRLLHVLGVPVVGLPAVYITLKE